MDDLIQRFASCATVVVATRDLPGPRGVGLVKTMVPDDVIDLADVDLAVSTQRALHDYVVNRLTGVDARMEPALVADHVSASTGDGELPFLLGRLVTDELRSSPVDRPTRVGAARRDVRGRGLRARPGTDLCRRRRVRRPGRRQQLTALTWAFGAGLPEDEWRTVTASLTGHEIDRDDVSRVLEHLGRYVVQDGEDGTAVYRIAHQALADHLRPGFVGSWDVPFDPSAAGIAIALVERTERCSTPACRPDGPPTSGGTAGGTAPPLVRPVSSCSASSPRTPPSCASTSPSRSRRSPRCTRTGVGTTTPSRSPGRPPRACACSRPRTPT